MADDETVPDPGDSLDLAPDITLSMLVRLANGPRIGVPVTLTLGGLLVSGQIVPGRVHFDQLIDVIQAANYTGEHSTEETNEAVKAALSGGLAEFRDGLYPAIPTEADVHRPVGFIHLKDASIWSGGWTRVGAWRGRLSEVTGWTLGEPGNR